METIFQVEQHQEILSSLATIISVDSNCLETKLTQICALLKQEIKTYDWVGFYFVKQSSKTLHLKAFAGIPSDHTVIPFGKGICGQVAISNKNFVVDDVHAQDNYISCNIDVKSEIVIPLFLNNENIGQIDIDSNTINAFNESDVVLLEKINEKISNYMLSNKLSINIS